jgi:hypothetical protein
MKQNTIFAPGQMWSYATRPGEEQSRIIIDAVDHDERLGTMVYVTVQGIGIKNPRLKQGIQDMIHLPFSEEALYKSGITKVSDNEQLPAFQEGYEEWKKQNGGVFTVPVADVLAAIEKSMPVE